MILVLVSYVYATPSLNALSRGLADTLYCKLSGDCTLADLIITGNLTVYGDIVNTSVLNINTTNVYADTIYQGGEAINDTFLKLDGTNSPTNGIDWGNQFLFNAMEINSTSFYVTGTGSDLEPALKFYDGIGFFQPAPQNLVLVQDDASVIMTWSDTQIVSNLPFLMNTDKPLRFRSGNQYINSFNSTVLQIHGERIVNINSSNLTVNYIDVCLEDGTNCPASGSGSGNCSAVGSCPNVSYTSYENNWTADQDYNDKMNINLAIKTGDVSSTGTQLRYLSGAGSDFAGIYFYDSGVVSTDGLNFESDTNFIFDGDFMVENPHYFSTGTTTTAYYRNYFYQNNGFANNYYSMKSYARTSQSLAGGNVGALNFEFQSYGSAVTGNQMGVTGIVNHQSSGQANTLYGGYYTVRTSSTGNQYRMYGTAARVDLRSSGTVDDAQCLRGEWYTSSYTGTVARAKSMYLEEVPAAANAVLAWSLQSDGDIQINSDKKFILEGNSTSKGDTFIIYNSTQDVIDIYKDNSQLLELNNSKLGLGGNGYYTLCISNATNAIFADRDGDGCGDGE